MRLPWRRRISAECVYCGIEEKAHRALLLEVHGWDPNEYESIVCPSVHGHFFTNDPDVCTFVLHAWDGK